MGTLNSVVYLETSDDSAHPSLPPTASDSNDSQCASSIADGSQAGDSRSTLSNLDGSRSAISKASHTSNCLHVHAPDALFPQLAPPPLATHHHSCWDLDSTGRSYWRTYPNSLSWELLPLNLAFDDNYHWTGRIYPAMLPYSNYCSSLLSDNDLPWNHACYVRQHVRPPQKSNHHSDGRGAINSHPQSAHFSKEVHAKVYPPP